MIKRIFDSIPNYTSRLKNELSRQYYLYDGEFEHGPYTLEELRSKKLSRNSMIWHSMLKEWHTVAEVPEVAAVVDDPPPVQRETDSRYSPRDNSTTDHKTSPGRVYVNEKKKSYHRSFYMNTALVVSIGIIIWMVFTTC